MLILVPLQVPMPHLSLTRHARQLPACVLVPLLLHLTRPLTLRRRRDEFAGVHEQCRVHAMDQLAGGGWPRRSMATRPPMTALRRVKRRQHRGLGVLMPHVFFLALQASAPWRPRFFFLFFSSSPVTTASLPNVAFFVAELKQAYCQACEPIIAKLAGCCWGNGRGPCGRHF